MEEATTQMISEREIREAIKAINQWHPNTPLLLALSKQFPGPEGDVSGNIDAVRSTYDSLFNLESIGIQDSAKEFYLHFCHGPSGSKEYPYAIRKPTDNYGKTHQRIINDTFAGNKNNSFLSRRSAGHYKLKEGAGKLMSNYLGISERIDLKPLVIYLNWKLLNNPLQIRDLWSNFCETYHVDKPPFNEVFTCSSLGEKIPLAEEGVIPDMRQICLPEMYGSGKFDADFWNRFRILLEQRFKELKWQGRTGPLIAGITTALMNDESIFITGDPGTGKTTLVREAILPSLRQAHGSENELAYSEYSITPYTTAADIFGFQGLDGNWINGPFADEVLNSYESDDESIVIQENSCPHLVFFDEANRVDIESILSPIQNSLDKMQQRNMGGAVTLGRNKFMLPRKLWRIFAGNSPSKDIGRKEQSRPFKRRMSTIIATDPMEDIIQSSARFRATCLEILEASSKSNDVEINEPALSYLGDLSTNSQRLEDLRRVLEKLRENRQLAITVGLLKAILMRAASYNILRQEGSLDPAISQTMIGLLCGEYHYIEDLMKTAQDQGFPEFAKSIQQNILNTDSHLMGHGIESLL